MKIKKRIVKYFIVIAALLMSLGIYAFAGDFGYGIIIANGGLNLRTQTSTDSPRICVIPDRTVVSVNAMTPDGRWYDVTYNGHVGILLPTTAPFVPMTLQAAADI